MSETRDPRAPLPWSGERYVPEVTGNIRLEHVHRYLMAREWCRGRRVLDIACGEGYGSDLLAQVAAEVTGVDLSVEAVAHARATYQRPNVTFTAGDCTAIPLADASVEVVVSFETIEHVSHHDEVMREVRRVLVPGGVLIISSPDRREYADRPQYVNPYHVKELYREEFERLLHAHFAHVALAGQQMKAGSLVWAIDGTAGPFEGFAATESIDRVEPMGPPVYLIAVASDGPLAPISTGLLDGGGFVWFADHASASEQSERAFHAHVISIDAARAAAEARATTADTAVLAAEARAAAADAARDAADAARDATEVARDAAEARAMAADRALATEADRSRSAAQAETAALRAEVAALRDLYAKLEHHARALDADRQRFETTVRVMEQSKSWRLGAPFRALRRALGAGRGASSPASSARAIYAALPLSIERRLRIRTFLFRTFPFVFRRTPAFRAWQAYSRTEARLQAPAPVPAAAGQSHETLPGWYYSAGTSDYVPLASAHVDTRIKAIAFYLPQFHPIAENDRWWGRGFTEWTNVARGKPQFAGHYQPHLPGELGFYDLRVPAVQHRQIELAKLYGVYGFCYHHYWFGGTRLLRQPLDQMLADPGMDLPFCLCWANENWTRRWDGKEEEVLIAQRHSPDDDLAFIRDIEPALRDPRYIRIDGRPLLVVYRPSLLPDARATAGRWRAYCRDAGLGDLYLVSTRAFDTADPATFGFDAALEFTPNNMGVPVITQEMSIVNPAFRGVIYDYRYLIEHSRTAMPPAGYPLFRTVTPMWDNEPRRPGRGAVFAHASPALYREALEQVCRYTDAHLGPGKPFVFVNAWNEWAEGAHLEPDQRYGYAYLQATADALNRFPSSRPRPRIVLVSHDAYFHGAQKVAVALARTLSEQLEYAVDILLCGDGPLRSEFERYGRVYDCSASRTTADERHAVVKRLREAGARVALCNTSVIGSTVELLHDAGFTVVSMIHELPGIIAEHGLDASIAAIARSADHVVFPARVVRDRFIEATGVPESRTRVRPQGLIAPNRFRGRRDEALAALRQRLRLSPDRTIVLGMGYADRRKGVDLFVEAGLTLVDRIPDLTMVWVGHADEATLADAEARVAAAGREEFFLFPGLADDPDEYFAGANLFLMTSREDPFPLVVLHALDAEIPVVGFEGAGGFVELLERGCGRLVPYLDAPAMAEAAIDLLTHPGVRHPLARTGRDIIDREFDFTGYARFLVDLGSGRAPRVSVVVPSYNYARYLPARLHSILAQTYRPHEILVLDDGSTDDSVAVAEEVLRHGPIPYRIVRNQTNQGVYRQWLRGLQEASGDLVWIAEADDDCAPTLLETLVPAFARPSVVLAYCQSRQIDEAGHELAPDYLSWTADISETKWRAGYVRRGADEIADTLAIKNTIPNVSAVLWRKPDLSAIEGRLATMRRAGDWLLYVHVLEHGDISYMPDVLNDHRRHPGSVTIGQGGVALMQEILQVGQYVRDRHTIAGDVEAKRLTNLQTTYEYLQLDRNGPASFGQHDALRPLVGVDAD